MGVLVVRRRESQILDGLFNVIVMVYIVAI